MTKGRISRFGLCFFLWSVTHSLSASSSAPALVDRGIEASADATSLSSHNDGAYPRVTYLADGGMLATFTRIRSVQGRDEKRIIVSRSDDEGMSWREIGEVTRGFQDIGNAFPLQLKQTFPGGIAPRLLVAFRNHDRDNAGRWKLMRITVCRSDDNGKSWVFHSEVDLSAPEEGTWEPFLLDAPDGSLQIYYARERGGPQDIVMKRSFDGGRTWGPRTVVASQGQARDGMPAVATFREASGREGLFVIYESGLNGRFSIYGSRSYDGGHSWQQRQLIYSAEPPFNAGAPQVVRLSNGILIASFMTDEGQPRQNWPFNAATKAVFADVEGGSWNWIGKFTLASAQSLWPGLLAAKDGGFYATYGKDGAQVKHFQIREN